MTDYRIDELAQASGTTVRNIRAYQDRGLLLPPLREGRVGLYTDAHLARLRLVGRMLERGYTINNISELISAWESSRDLTDILGFEKGVDSFWSDEIPSYATAEELAELGDGQLRPALMQKYEQAGWIVPEGDRYRIRSPRLLHAVVEFFRAGVPADVVTDLVLHLSATIDEAAGRLVDAIATHVLHADKPGWMPSAEELPAAADFVQRIKPLTSAAMDAMLSQALQRHADTVLGEVLDKLLPAPAARHA